jgi:regulator of protease activity HflC (stomatin/prohibitin superfamily)
MNVFKRFVVKKNQRGLLLRDGDFLSLLEPGLHRYRDFGNRLTLEVFDLDKALFEHPMTGYLRKHEPALVAQYFECMDLNENQVGLRFEDNNLVEILPPGSRRLYWKGQAEQRLQQIELSTTYRLDPALTAQLGQVGLRGKAIEGMAGVLIVQVPAFQVGVLKVAGQEAELLQAGSYGFWRFNRQISVELVETRMQALEVAGQEILTRDKVSLRLNLSANWRYEDVLKAFSQLAKPLEHVYRELQFGLRAAVGTRTLDELLENKQLIDDTVTAHMHVKLAGSGLQISGLGVRDIILPGEMKVLLAKVVEAEKAAQANVIRRREETSATRSLLNTAKVMEENPTALRLKELETLERVAERIDRISVFGGLDQVLNGLVTIAPR